MNWALIGAVASLCTGAVGFFYGVQVGEDQEFAKRAREDAIVAKVSEAAQLSAAEAIARIKPRNTTIRQEVEREIQTDVRYVDCRLTDGVFDALNETLTGKRAEPAGGRKLPGTGATGR